MGATVEGDVPPLRIVGRSDLEGIDYRTPVPSAQIKSCILLAGLRAQGTTTVTESTKSRDHTERMLRAAGVEVGESGLSVSVQGGARLHPFTFDCPGDISSAAFFMVAAAIVPEAEVALRGVGVNPTRTGILDVFEQAGVPVLRDNESEPLGEPKADLFVRHQGPGLPFQIDGSMVARLIDEIPVLAVMATQLDGVSRIRGAAELRLKESDRIQTVASALTVMGANVTAYPDGLDIEGPVQLKGATVDACGDHRIAMAFAIAGLVAEGETQILGAEAIRTSYPGFERDLFGLCMY
jgi:3-phosphoshikimate 1-carboxyvinyltransferase